MTVQSNAKVINFTIKCKSYKVVRMINIYKQ